MINPAMVKPRNSKRPTGAALDEKTRRRRIVLAEMEQMSAEELFQIAVRAGIYTKDGKLTRPYQDEASASACRPTD